MVKKRKPPTRHEIDRVLVGNDIAIMRALMASRTNPPMCSEMEVRIQSIKTWWRDAYGEEVGFSASAGDVVPR